MSLPLDLLDHPLFEFGRPPNLAAWVVLVVGIGCFIVSWRGAASRHLASHATKICVALSVVAASLSAAYFFWVLGGGPRIIDATAYLCSARIFASGSFTFAAPEPSALFRGRFLIHPPGAPDQLGVIFPPGYPAFLSFFERFLDYRLAGPILAFAVTLGTYFLAFFLARAAAPAPEKLARARLVGLLAALLSLTSAALRYHTADTMSHGLSTALLLMGGLVVVRAWSRASLGRGGALLLGFSLGLLFATRPLTAFAASAVLLIAARPVFRRSHALSLALGLLPGALLLFAHQKALTGSFWDSVQLRYYALADGPASCFGLGFGKGCEYEHGDVIEQRGKLGPLWAILNSLHRLHNHSLDLANCELLFGFLAFRLVQTRKERNSRLVLFALGTFTLAYSLFYFDGSYPGGGARFLVELLPFEHALLAGFALDKLGALRTLGISCVSFALHGAYSHEALRVRDGGAPFLDQRLLETREPRVVFAVSDHAFLLGLRPEALEGAPGRSPRLTGTLVARRSWDFREAELLWGLRSPKAFVLEKEPPGSVLLPWSPPATSDVRRIEVERDFPPLSLEGMWVHPAHLSVPCVSSGRALRLRPQPGSARGSLGLWVDGVRPGRYQARLIFWTEERGCFAKDDVMLSAPGVLSVGVDWRDPSPLFLDRIELETTAEGQPNSPPGPYAPLPASPRLLHPTQLSPKER